MPDITIDDIVAIHTWLCEQPEEGVTWGEVGENFEMLRPQEVVNLSAILANAGYVYGVSYPKGSLLPDRIRGDVDTDLNKREAKRILRQFHEAEQIIVVDLTALATRINDCHDRATISAREALVHARDAGLLLIEAKAKVAHGQWLPWLTANCKVSARQAQRYMKVATNWDTIAKNDVMSHLTITEALKPDPAARIESLPVGRMFELIRPSGYAMIFRSAKHPDYFHFYGYVLRTAADSEWQGTRRPCRAVGILAGLRREGVSLDEFTEVDDDGTNELPYDPSPAMECRQDFFELMLADSTENSEVANRANSEVNRTSSKIISE